MKKSRRKIFLCFLAVFFYAAAPACYPDGGFSDSRMERAGDWFAALGKKGGEKQQFLLRRKIERRAEKARKASLEASRDRKKNARKMAEAAEKRAKELRKNS